MEDGLSQAVRHQCRGGQRPAGPATADERGAHEPAGDVQESPAGASAGGAPAPARQGPGGRPGPGPGGVCTAADKAELRKAAGGEGRQGVQGHDQQAPGRAGRQDENVRAGYVGDEPGGERTGADQEAAGAAPGRPRGGEEAGGGGPAGQEKKSTAAAGGGPCEPVVPGEGEVLWLRMLTGRLLGATASIAKLTVLESVIQV
mmetsp:Transcript_5771/g.17386  ORF Transcript_5771/g.17386 Transcript_5771/m.17386 type:complete len:202 (-) Transcript_5771:1859-2464(-)